VLHVITYFTVYRLLPRLFKGLRGIGLMKHGAVESPVSPPAYLPLDLPYYAPPCFRPCPPQPTSRHF